MTWHGPVLDSDQRDLVAMLDAIAADTATDPASVEAGSLDPVVRRLVEVGVWTIGVPVSRGGGGADWPTAAVALERLGRHWPALGWAAVQVHAALVVLDETLGARLRGGTVPVAVVDASSAHVRLERTADRLVGTIDRLDATGADPHVVVLDGADVVHVIEPAALVGVEPTRTTGLDALVTSSVTVDADSATLTTLTGVDARAARIMLRLGVAAVAAGIAGAAADDAAAYSAERHQFGGPLTQLPTVRQSLASQAARAATSARAAMAPCADEVQAWSVLDQGCAAAVDVAAGALQSHGGYGYLAEYPVEHRLRDAVSLRAAADATGAALGAGRVLVGLPPDPSRLVPDPRRSHEPSL